MLVNQSKNNIWREKSRIVLRRLRHFVVSRANAKKFAILDQINPRLKTLI